MVKIFLDTDIGSDCDDTGALQILHTLCDQGKAELLGVTHCAGNPYGLQAVSVINRYNGREVPLGTLKRDGFLDNEICCRYNRVLAERYDHEFKQGQPQRPALEVFKEVMAVQEDHSVVVTAIGPLSNIADFVLDEEGYALIARKVRKLVCMAGRFDVPVAEWNVQMDIPAARAVIEKWPTPVVFCGFEAGVEVITGAGLEGRAGHPVREAYNINEHGHLRRCSWDLITVLYAVLGDSGWVRATEPGEMTLTEEGVTLYAPGGHGRHSYTVNMVSNEKLAGRLNALL